MSKFWDVIVKVREIEMCKNYFRYFLRFNIFYVRTIVIINSIHFIGNDQDLTKAHPDPFLRSMALWTLKEYQNSLSTLLIGNAGTQHQAHDDETRETKEADPNVFNFYVYLRTHPLLVRQHIANVGQRKAFLPGGHQVDALQY